MCSYAYFLLFERFVYIYIYVLPFRNEKWLTRFCIWDRTKQNSVERIFHDQYEQKKAYMKYEYVVPTYLYETTNDDACLTSPNKR